MKRLLHKAGAVDTENNRQLCSRCQIFLWAKSTGFSQDAKPYPVGANITADGSRVETIDAKIYVSCSGTLDEITGIRPRAHQ